MLQGEHSAILSTFIKLPFVIKIFVLSILEWRFYTGVTVPCLMNSISFSKIEIIFTIFWCFSFECNIVEKGKQVRGVQHCWNIQDKNKCTVMGLVPGLTYRYVQTVI